jgi:voltage-gated potassium channel
LWEVLITASVVYLAIEGPADLVLNYAFPGRTIAYWISTLALCADVFVRGRPAMERWRRSSIAGALPTRAVRSAWFLVDIIAAIPFRALLPGGAPLELLRLLKLGRMVQLMNRWRQHAFQHANVLMLVFFAFWLLLIAHWLACGWIALGGIRAAGDQLTLYVRALYWCITTLATVGYGDIVPTNNRQMVYAMAVMLTGVGVYGYVIGNVANLLSNLDLAKRHYTENMDRLGAFLRYRNVPLELQRRIRDYYAYLWEHRMGYDESTIMADLPLGLRTEVALRLRRDFIESAPLFKNASHELVREIALHLHPAVFTPGDYIFRAGHHGRHMYFISFGTLEVISADGQTVATLKEGNFFGELALLFSQPRNASVRAVDYCDLYSLDKDTFDHTISRYPDFARQIREEAERRQSQSPDAR